MTLEVGDETMSERPSNSYPGLPTIVRIHQATVELSPGQFRPEGYIELQEKKSTHLLWHRVA